jgi:cyanophycinase
MPAVRFVLLTTLLAFAGAASPAAPAGADLPAAGGRPAGSLIIAGGGSLPPVILKRFLELARPPGSGGAERPPRILVLPMASGSPDSGPEQAAEFAALGAEATSAAVTRERALDPAAATLLHDVTGVWFTGGDQSRVTAAIGGTPFLAALHERHRRGAVIGGSSAGAAIMSPLMITGDERRPAGGAPAGDDQRDAFLTLARDNIVTVEGLGFLPGAIVDQHFVRRKRHNRLLSLVLEHPGLVGAGIDEGTALEVAPDGRWSVLGDGVVVIYDARRAALPAGPSDPAAPLQGAGVILHVLASGGRYHPETGRVDLPSGR